MAWSWDGRATPPDLHLLVLLVGLDSFKVWSTFQADLPGNDKQNTGVLAGPTATSAWVGSSCRLACLCVPPKGLAETCSSSTGRTGMLCGSFRISSGTLGWFQEARMKISQGLLCPKDPGRIEIDHSITGRRWKGTCLLIGAKLNASMPGLLKSWLGLSSASAIPSSTISGYLALEVEACNNCCKMPPKALWATQ